MKKSYSKTKREKKMVLQCGGEDTIKHGKAQKDIWMEILTFFETSLRT